MAGKKESPAEKVERLLAVHNAKLALVLKHQDRVAATLADLDVADGNMGMFATHRDVPAELKAKVEKALADSKALVDGTYVRPAPVEDEATESAESTEDEATESAESAETAEPVTEDATPSRRARRGSVEPVSV